MLELHATKGRVALRLRALFMGRDLCVLLDGGHSPHVGAIAVAGKHSFDATAQLTELPGHREGPLAHELVTSLRDVLGTTVVVICGIHVDNIYNDEIALTLDLARGLAHSLSQRLKLPQEDTTC